MSGHSKWSKIKRKKGVADSKRANIFTKLAKNITIAARNGDDPDMNFTLKLAMNQAKAANMPKDNIQRAIDSGSKKNDGSQLEEKSFEGYGPAGIAFIVETVSDNNNRVVAEVKAILTKFGGSLGAPGSVMWMFTKKGTISISKEDMGETESEDLQMKAIELEALDIIEESEGITIYTEPEKLSQTVETLEKDNIKITESEISMIASDEIEVEDNIKEKIERIFEALDENDDVVNYYTNAKV